MTHLYVCCALCLVELHARQVMDVDDCTRCAILPSETIVEQHSLRIQIHEAIAELPNLPNSGEEDDDSGADSPPPSGASGFGSCNSEEEDDVADSTNSIASSAATIPPLRQLQADFPELAAAECLHQQIAALADKSYACVTHGVVAANNIALLSADCRMHPDPSPFPSLPAPVG